VEKAYDAMRAKYIVLLPAPPQGIPVHLPSPPSKSRFRHLVRACEGEAGNSTREGQMTGKTQNEKNRNKCQ
jgi:hypothetical protein